MNGQSGWRTSWLLGRGRDVHQTNPANADGPPRSLHFLSRPLRRHGGVCPWTGAAPCCARISVGGRCAQQPWRANMCMTGLRSHRFATDPRPRLELAYGVCGRNRCRRLSRRLMHKLRPRIVHLHARTSAVSGRLVDAAHAAGASVIFTYHSPTVSCARGTMMLFGEQPCDGVVEARRCTTLRSEALGVPKAFRRFDCCSARSHGRHRCQGCRPCR